MNKFFGLCLSFVVIMSSCKKSDPVVVVELPPTLPSTELPAGAKDGVAYINSGKSAIITLYAPAKTSVSVIGEFNNWQSSSAVMKNTPDGGRWWVQIDSLDPNSYPACIIS